MRLLASSYDRGEIFRRAEKYRSQRRIRKAVREYEKILTADPGDNDVLIRIAPLYVRAGRKDQAKASLRRSSHGTRSRASPRRRSRRCGWP